jgi:hypothetical protein
MAKIPAASYRDIVGSSKRPLVTSTGHILTPLDVQEMRKGDGLPIGGGGKGKRASHRKANLGLTVCPKCQCEIAPKNLARHLRTVHA